MRYKMLFVPFQIWFWNRLVQIWSKSIVWSWKQQVKRLKMYKVSFFFPVISWRCLWMQPPALVHFRIHAWWGVSGVFCTPADCKFDAVMALLYLLIATQIKNCWNGERLKMMDNVGYNWRIIRHATHIAKQSTTKLETSILAMMKNRDLLFFQTRCVWCVI